MTCKRWALPYICHCCEFDTEHLYDGFCGDCVTAGCNTDTSHLDIPDAPYERWVGK